MSTAFSASAGARATRIYGTTIATRRHLPARAPHPPAAARARLRRCRPGWLSPLVPVARGNGGAGKGREDPALDLLAEGFGIGLDVVEGGADGRRRGCARRGRSACRAPGARAAAARQPRAHTEACQQLKQYRLRPIALVGATWRRPSESASWACRAKAGRLSGAFPVSQM